MKITSNLLGELGAALKLSQVSPQETTIDVPPTVLPVLNVRSTVRLILALSNTNIPITSSFIGSWQNTVNNAGLLAQGMFNLPTGLWELDIVASYSANYAVTPGNGGIIIVDDGTLIGNLFEGVCAVAAGGMVTMTRKIQIQTDRTLNFSAKLGANGAGNIHNLSLSFVVSKLF